MKLKKHNPGCCCLKTYPTGITHECWCGCIGITGTYAPDDLIRSVDADGVVCGKPIEITPGETFRTELTIPPLHRPEIEVLVETIQIKNAQGEVTQTVYKASLGQTEVKIGGVTVKLKQPMVAMSAGYDDAGLKLGRLVGLAVAQAWVDLLHNGEPEAARSMEIGS